MCDLTFLGTSSSKERLFTKITFPPKYLQKISGIERRDGFIES